MSHGSNGCITRCCMCYKSCTATCKTCILSRLSFYSTRMDIDKSIQVKKDKGQEIERLLDGQLKMEEDANAATLNIRSLKAEIQRRKDVMEQKRISIAELKIKKDRHKKRIEILQATIQKVAINKEKKPENQVTRDEKLIELEKQRTLYCRYMYGIYPLRKVDGEYVIRNTGQHSIPQSFGSSFKRQFSLNPQFNVRHPTPQSLLNRSPDPHSLALLVFSSHLVRVLAQIMDLTLPGELFVHSLISTNEAYRSQWTKLSIAVNYLCNSLGVKVSDPHSSLISLFERLCEGPIRVNSSLPLTLFEQSNDISDLEESNEWDTCDDFDPLTASVLAPQGYFK